MRSQSRLQPEQSHLGNSAVGQIQSERKPFVLSLSKHERLVPIKANSALYFLFSLRQAQAERNRRVA